MRPYPVFLRLEGRRALLVGGSAVAAAAERAGSSSTTRMPLRPGPAACGGGET